MPRVRRVRVKWAALNTTALPASSNLSKNSAPRPLWLARICRQQAASSRCGPLRRTSGRLFGPRPRRHATRKPSPCASVRSSGMPTGVKHRSRSCSRRRRCRCGSQTGVAPWRTRRGSALKLSCYSESCARRRAGTAGTVTTLLLSHPSATSLLSHPSSRQLSCLSAVSRLLSRQLGRREVAEGWLSSHQLRQASPDGLRCRRRKCAKRQQPSERGERRREWSVRRSLRRRGRLRGRRRRRRGR